MSVNKKRVGVAAAVVLAGGLVGYLLRSAPQKQSAAVPTYDHVARDHVAPVSSEYQAGRCYDVFPSDSELPPIVGAHFEDWHKNHYGTEAKDVQFSSGINWRKIGGINGDGVYVSYGTCTGHRFERVAYQGRTALVVDSVGPIESRIDAILESLR